MNDHIEHRNDYDHVVKIDRQRLVCYSKAQLKRRHPQGDYTLVGESVQLFAQKGKRAPQGMEMSYGGRLSLSVTPYRHRRRLLYREAGYLSLGDGRYLALLKPIWPLWLLLLLLLCVAIPAAVTLDQTGQTDPTDPPHIVPMPSEPTTATDPTQPGDSDSGGSLALSYVLEAKTSLSTGEVGVYVANPYRSTVDIVVELYVEGETAVFLARSEKVSPGNSLILMDADPDTLARLSLGQYRCYYRVICFDVETGAQSLVEPKITDVILTVID